MNEEMGATNVEPKPKDHKDPENKTPATSKTETVSSELWLKHGFGLAHGCEEINLL